VRRLAFFTKEGKAIVNHIVKNEFKEARGVTLEILNYLRYDPYMAENLGSISNTIRTSFIKLVKISTKQSNSPTKIHFSNFPHKISNLF